MATSTYLVSWLNAYLSTHRKKLWWLLPTHLLPQVPYSYNAPQIFVYQMDNVFSV